MIGHMLWERILQEEDKNWKERILETIKKVKEAKDKSMKVRHPIFVVPPDWDEEQVKTWEAIMKKAT